MDTSETQPDLQQRRGRLAFAGVIVLLGVIYMVRNIDRYEDLNTESVSYTHLTLPTKA